MYLTRGSTQIPRRKKNTQSGLVRDITVPCPPADTLANDNSKSFRRLLHPAIVTGAKSSSFSWLLFGGGKHFIRAGKFSALASLSLNRNEYPCPRRYICGV